MKVLNSIFYIPMMWARAAQALVNYPSIPNLTIESIDDVAQPATTIYNKSGMTQPDVRPPLRIFRFATGVDRAIISIDKIKQEVYWPRTSLNLFGKHYREGSVVVDTLLSAPVLLFFLPFLLTAKISLDRFEKVIGLDRYGARILHNLRGKLSKDDEELLSKAFSKMLK